MRTARQIETDNVPFKDLTDDEVLAMAEFYRNMSRMTYDKAAHATVATMYLTEAIRRLMAANAHHEDRKE